MLKKIERKKKRGWNEGKRMRRMKGRQAGGKRPESARKTWQEEREEPGSHGDKQEDDAP